MSLPVYIGAESIISSLGRNAAVNFKRICQGLSGITLHKQLGWKESDVYLSRIPELPERGKFLHLLNAVLDDLHQGWDADMLSSPDTQVIISSTKGGISDDLKNPFHPAVTALVARYSLVNRPLILSNACISGVIAINLAARMIRNELCRHVIVLGCDLISDFILYGFQSLYAVSDLPCKPFDQDRRGVTLGDGCGRVILSRDKSTFSSKPMVYLGGSDANDANHISGPSRTGEGLVRAVEKALIASNVNPDQIGFINAHGTGTLYNDEMEAIAFHRLGLDSIPLNSLKGYWGHTLGAAGVIETATCLQSLRNGILPASLGYENPGTTKPLHILKDNRPFDGEIILKTASGFGGGNAALLIQKE